MRAARSPRLGRAVEAVRLADASGAGGASVAWTWPSAPRRDGRERPRILCEEVAALLGTINYGVTCDVAPRVVRRYRGEAPAE